MNNCFARNAFKILAIILSLGAHPVSAHHFCPWLQSTGVEVLSNVYTGNMSWVQDRLEQLGVPGNVAGSMVQSASKMVGNSDYRVRNVCEYRSSPQSNPQGLGQVFGTGGENYNACVSRLGKQFFKEDLQDALAGCASIPRLRDALH